MKRLISLSIILFVGSFLTLSNAEMALGQFYKGKNIILIVSSTPGGGNDTYSRLLARHISKHIPGKPGVIVKNMPGGGGLVAANYLYERAKRDGTAMQQVQWGVWHYQGIKDKRARFDLSKMNAVGAIVIENNVIYSRTDRYKSLDEILKSGKLAKIGVTGRQSTAYVLGHIIEKMTGRKYFEYILGYPGARQYSLALRQGELDVSGNTVSSFLDQLGDMYKAGDLTVLAQSGDMKGERHKDFPDVPTLKEIATSEKGREIAEMTLFFSHYGRPYALPQDVPAERVKIIREAFDKTMKDPEFLAEAKRLHRPVDPLSGEELQQVFNKDVNPSPEMFEIVSEIFSPGKK